MKFFRKSICSKCQTGRDSLMLDERSPECPYLYFCDGKKCTKFVKLENSCQNRFLKKLFKN